MVGATTSTGGATALETFAIFALYFAVAVLVHRSSSRFRLETGSTPWGLPTWLWVLGVVLFLPVSLLYLLARFTTSRKLPPPAGPWDPSRPWGQPGQGPYGQGPYGHSPQGKTDPEPQEPSGLGPQDQAPSHPGPIPPKGGPPAGWLPGAWPTGPTSPPGRVPAPGRAPSGLPGSWAPPPWVPPGPGVGSTAAPPGSPVPNGVASWPGWPQPESPAEAGTAPQGPVAPWGTPISPRAQGLAFPPSTAPGWYVDPTERHFVRYWDGARWTDQVSTGGVQSIDPIDGTSQSQDPHPGGFSQSP